MAEKLQLTYTRSNKIKAWLYKYNILVNGKHVECNLIGWRTALAHARKRTTGLFDIKDNIVEILNLWTGEIITLKEAERRAAIHSKKASKAVISATT